MKLKLQEAIHPQSIITYYSFRTFLLILFIIIIPTECTYLQYPKEIQISNIVIQNSTISTITSYTFLLQRNDQSPGIPSDSYLQVTFPLQYTNRISYINGSNNVSCLSTELVNNIGMYCMFGGNVLIVMNPFSIVGTINRFFLTVNNVLNPFPASTYDPFEVSIYYANGSVFEQGFLPAQITTIPGNSLCMITNFVNNYVSSRGSIFISYQSSYIASSFNSSYKLLISMNSTYSNDPLNTPISPQITNYSAIGVSNTFQFNINYTTSINLSLLFPPSTMSINNMIYMQAYVENVGVMDSCYVSLVNVQPALLTVGVVAEPLTVQQLSTYTFTMDPSTTIFSTDSLLIQFPKVYNLSTLTPTSQFFFGIFATKIIQISSSLSSTTTVNISSLTSNYILSKIIKFNLTNVTNPFSSGNNNVSVKVTIVTVDGYVRATGGYNVLIESGVMRVNYFNCSTYQIGYKSPCKLSFTTSNYITLNSQILLTYPTSGWMTVYNGSNTKCVVVSSSPQINSIFQCRYNDTLRAFVFTNISSNSSVIGPFTAIVSIQQSSVDVDNRVQLPWVVGNYSLTLASYSGDGFVIDLATLNFTTTKRQLFISDNNSLTFSSSTTMTMTNINIVYTLPNVNNGSYNMRVYLPLKLSGQVGDIGTTYGSVVRFDEINQWLTIRLGDITLMSDNFTINGFKTFDSTKPVTYTIEYFYQSIVYYYFSTTLSIPHPKLPNTLSITQLSTTVYQPNNLSVTISELQNGDILTFGTTNYTHYYQQSTITAANTTTTWCSPSPSIINCNADNSITVISANNADQTLGLTQFNFIIINSQYVGKSNFFITVYDSTGTYIKQNGSFILNVQQMNTINPSTITYTSSNPYFNQSTTLTISFTLSTPGASTLTINFPTGYQLLTSRCITNCMLPTINQSTILFSAQLTIGQVVSVEFQLINPMNFTQSIVIMSMDSQGRNVDYGQIMLNAICQNPCRSCSVNDTTKCLSCYNFSINKTLSGTTCLTACPDGQYQTTQSLMFYCLACPSSCILCTTNTTCQQCKSSYIYFNSTCISSCPSGYLMSVDSVTGAQQCIGCTSPCKECSGLSTNCSECIQGTYLFGNSCLSNCPLGYYKTTTNRCFQCSSNCSQCSDITGYCTICTTNYYLYQNSCYTQCPITGYAKNITSGKCQLCTTTCTNCGQYITQCQYCRLGYFLMNGSCLSTCPDGYYGNVGTRSCSLCQEPCAKCSGSQSYCEACVAGKYLYNHQCYAVCPNGTYPSASNSTIPSCVSCIWPCTICTDPSTCSQCSSPYALNVSSCVLNCGNGNFINSANQCQQCDPSCRTCNITGCIDCSNPLDFLSAQSCVQQCSPLYKNQLTMICQQCHSPCATCLTNSTTCSQCLTPYSLLQSQSSCYLTCPSLYYSQNNYCKFCQQRNPNCKQCSLNNFTQSFTCSTCQQSAYYYGYLCIRECPTNTTVKNDICVSTDCPQVENCQLCSDLKCISCKALYTLENNTCSFQVINSISNLKAPFPFFILVLCTILSSILLKIYFKKMYIPMYLYSICGIFQIGCMLLWTGLAIMTSRQSQLYQPVNFYFGTLLLMIIYCIMNISSFILKFTLLNKDRKFLSWLRQDNFCTSTLITLVSLFVSFRLQLLMFSKLGNRESFSAIVQSKQKMFWVLVMSLVSIFFVSVPVISLACYLIYLQQQMNYLFFTCIQVAVIGLIMLVLSILTYLTPEGFFVEQKDQYRKGYVEENFVQGKSIEGLLGVEEEHYEQGSVGTILGNEVQARSGDVSSISEDVDYVSSMNEKIYNTKLSVEALQMKELDEQHSQSMQHIILHQFKAQPEIKSSQILLQQQSRQKLASQLQQTLIKKQRILNQLIGKQNEMIMRVINANFEVLEEQDEKEQHLQQQQQSYQRAQFEDSQYKLKSGSNKMAGRIYRQFDNISKEMAIIQSQQQYEQQEQQQQQQQTEQQQKQEYTQKHHQNEQEDRSEISNDEEYLQEISYRDEGQQEQFNSKESGSGREGDSGQRREQQSEQYQRQQWQVSNSCQLLKGRQRSSQPRQQLLNNPISSNKQSILDSDQTLSLSQQTTFLKQYTKSLTIQQNIQNIQKIKSLLQQLTRQQQQEQRLKLKLHQLNNDLSQQDYIKLRENIQHDNMVLEDKLSRLNQMFYRRKQQRDYVANKNKRKIRNNDTYTVQNQKYIHPNFKYKPEQKNLQQVQPKRVKVQPARKAFLKNINSNGIIQLKTNNNKIQTKSKTSTKSQNKYIINTQSKTIANTQNKIKTKPKNKPKIQQQQPLPQKVRKEEKVDRKRIISATLPNRVSNKVRRVNQLESINEQDRKSSSDSSSFMYLPILSQRTNRTPDFTRVDQIQSEDIQKQDNNKYQSSIKPSGFIRSNPRDENRKLNKNPLLLSSQYNSNNKQQSVIEQESKSSKSWQDEQVFVPKSSPLILTEPLEQDQPGQMNDLNKKEIDNINQINQQNVNENKFLTIQQDEGPIENIMNEGFQHWPIDSQLQERINKVQQLANSYLRTNTQFRHKVGNSASATLYPNHAISQKRSLQLISGSHSNLNIQRIDTNSRENSIFNDGRQTQVDFNYPNQEMIVFEDEQDIIDQVMKSREKSFKKSNVKHADVIELEINSKIKVPRKRGNRSVINISPGEY